MTTIEKSIDVQAPVRRAYNQWTQFETFPSFMAGVERVSQLTPTLTHWEVNVGGVRREFDAQITEQHPDERVAWKSVDGPEHGGVVTFHRLDDRSTRVHLQMQYHPDTLTEKAGAALGAVGSRIKGDLERFKEFIEHRDQETGAWRGEVDRAPQHGEHQPPPAQPEQYSGQPAQYADQPVQHPGQPAQFGGGQQQPQFGGGQQQSQFGGSQQQPQFSGQPGQREPQFRGQPGPQPPQRGSL